MMVTLTAGLSCPMVQERNCLRSSAGRGSLLLAASRATTRLACVIKEGGLRTETETIEMSLEYTTS